MYNERNALFSILFKCTFKNIKKTIVVSNFKCFLIPAL